MVGLALLYYNPKVQTYLGKKGAEYLSREWKTRVKIKSIRLTGLHQLDIQGLLIDDQSEDTLLSVPHLFVEIIAFQNIDIKNRKIRVDQIQLDRGTFFLKQEKNHVLNLDFILKYFDSGKKASSSKPYSINLHSLVLNNFHFKYQVKGSVLSLNHRINFSNLDLTQVNLKLSDFQLNDQGIKGNLEKLNLREKSGFDLKNLRAKIQASKSYLSLKQLTIATSTSKIQSQISFNFSKWTDFDDFDNRVRFKSNFKNTILNTDDIDYFTSILDPYHIIARINGSVSGKTDHLELENLLLNTGTSTEISGNFKVNDITDLKRLHIETYNGKIQTTRQDLNEIFRKIGQDQLNKEIPKQLNLLQSIQIAGSYKGGLYEFVTDISVQTNLGGILGNLHYFHPNSGLPRYGGTLSSTSFPLGKILGEPDLGEISLNGRISGSGFGAETHLDTLDTDIKYLDFRGYRYKNIIVRGSQQKKAFSGKIRINDPNLGLGFRGTIDLNGVIPIFNFNAEIFKADFLKLGFTKDSITLKSKLQINITGSSTSNLNGNILATATTLSKGSNSFYLDSIEVGARKLDTLKYLYIKSCILDAQINGRYDFKNLPIELKEIIGKYLPSTHWNDSPKESNQEFTFTANLKDLSPVTELFYPRLFISPASNLFGNFNSQTQVISLNGIFPKISYGTLNFGPVIIDAENVEAGSIDINISADSVTLGKSVLARSINIANSVDKDTLKFNLKVEDVNSVNHLDLNGLIAVNDTKAGLSILPSTLVLENKVWKIENSFKIGFEPDRTVVNGFKISHNLENIALNGSISSKSEDSVLTVFHNFGLSNLNQIIKQYGFTLSGYLNGKANLSSILGNTSFSSNLKVDSLQFNSTLLGDADINNKWDGEKSNLDFKGAIRNKILSVIQLEGSLGLSKKNDTMNATLNMDHAKAVLLEPFTKGIVSQLGGTLSSKIIISGKRDHPIINGRLSFNQTELTVDYLNTHYKINDSIQFNNGQVDLNNVKLLDPSGHIALINGSLNLSEISNPILNADIHADNFLSLNTNEKQGDQYYGRAFSTGDYSFSGPINQVSIIIDAKTMPGTVLNIPLNRPNTVGQKDFITFVHIKDSVGSAKKRRNIHKGITLDFNLNVTPEATVKLIFDEKIGDIIRGSGTSDLNLQLTPLGEFFMYGTFEIEKGDYLFTSQNILNKLFTIEKGGSIRFDGDPLNADIDLFADYQARANVSPLYTAANITSLYQNETNSVLVNSNIHLSGTLSDPAFDFTLKFPLAPYIEQELSTYFTSKQIVTTQSMLFLISNQFNGELNATNGYAIALSTGVQFVGNQLSNLLNNFSNRLDINLRSTTDFGLAFRTLSNRLQLTGNVSNTANLNPTQINIFNPSNPLTSDAEASYSLNKLGTVRLKGFWRPVPVDFFQFSNTGAIVSPTPTTTQGLGLFFTKEFSSLRDLFRRKPKVKDSTSSTKFSEIKSGSESKNPPPKVDFKEIKK